ncbi:MAG: IPT/TIG domain-containing protein [Actinomycetota bacterium]|nr:IPT/TIG domain-containing protein [Actinomycetota bacterium]
MSFDRREAGEPGAARRGRIRVPIAATVAMAATVAGVVLVSPWASSAASATVARTPSAPVSVTPSPSPAFAGDAPDPDIVFDGSDYFAFSTGTALGNHIQALVSSNLDSGYQSYSGHPYGSTALATPPAWETVNTQTSPGVFYWGGRWLMYYDAAQAPAAGDTGHDCISVAIGQATLPASDPQFTDTSTGGLICQPTGSIDPSPFVDPATGNAYLLWKQNDGGSTDAAKIWSQQLSPDGLSLVGQPHELLYNNTVSYPWEGTVENPDMVDVNGTYYLLFSAGVYTTSGYSEGITTCAGPAGPCGGQSQILTSYGSVLGPGGGSFVAGPTGAWSIAYDAWQGGGGGCTNYSCGAERDLFVAPVDLPAFPPQVTGVSPDGGPTIGGTTVTISGSNLADPFAVDFGSRAATVTSASATQIVATTPPGVIGPANLSVASFSGVATAPKAFSYFSAAPQITSLSPTSGSVAGLTRVTITGENLSQVGVDFAWAKATVVASSQTSATVITPPGSAGPVSVTVANAAGQVIDRAAYTYVVPPPPAIAGISPTSGPQAGDTLVTVTGINLASVTGVAFGSSKARVYADPNSGSSVVVVSPPGTAGAAVDVTIVTAGGEAADTGAFTYTAPVADPYTPITPLRICDTRPNNPSQLSGAQAQCNGAGGADGRILPGRALTVAVAGNFGVPPDASAVVLNVTALGAVSPGYVTVYPADQLAPTASNVNVTPGRVVANLTEAAVGAAGAVSIVSDTALQVIVDLEGYAAPPPTQGAGLYNPLGAPARICDTRPNNPSQLSGALAQCNGKRLSPGTPLVVDATGRGGVPAQGVAAVVLNVTAVDPAGAGYLTVYPSGDPRPTASNVNFAAGQTVANRAIVPVGKGGAVSLDASQSADAVVDVSGWFTTAGGTGTQFTPLAAPVRICDTRSSQPANQCTGRTVALGTTLVVSATGLAGIPAGAKAVVVNLTAVQPSASTFLTVYPGGSTPVVSDLNVPAGAVAANLVVATVSSSGTISIYNSRGIVNVAVDVTGWYT